MLAIVGAGRWGKVYAATLEELGIRFTIGRAWGNCDGVIVATPPETHFPIAREVLQRGVPLLLEKPITLDPQDARELVKLGGIAFAGHTRLYSPSWRKFKASLSHVSNVHASAGGTSRNPWWDWGPHLAAMCLDVGVDPRKAEICVSRVKYPLSFTAGGETWMDDPREKPLEVLITEFVAAIERGEPDNQGLRLGAEVVEFLHESRGPYVS